MYKPKVLLLTQHDLVWGISPSDVKFPSFSYFKGPIVADMYDADIILFTPDDSDIIDELVVIKNRFTKTGVFKLDSSAQQAQEEIAEEKEDKEWINDPQEYTSIEYRNSITGKRETLELESVWVNRTEAVMAAVIRSDNFLEENAKTAELFLDYWDEKTEDVPAFLIGNNDVRIPINIDSGIGLKEKEGRWILTFLIGPHAGDENEYNS